MESEHKDPRRIVSPQMAYAILADVFVWKIKRLLREQHIKLDKETAYRLWDYGYKPHTNVFVEDGEVVVSTQVMEGIEDQLRIGQSGRAEWYFQCGEQRRKGG